MVNGLSFNRFIFFAERQSPQTGGTGVASTGGVVARSARRLVRFFGSFIGGVVVVLGLVILLQYVGFMAHYWRSGFFNPVEFVRCDVEYWLTRGSEKGSEDEGDNPKERITNLHIEP